VSFVRSGIGSGYVGVMRAPARLFVTTSVLALLLAGCGSTLGEQQGVTKQSQGMFDLWHGSVIVALCVGALVVSLIIWCLLRYRRRGRDDIPNQRQYVIPLEIVYTAIPVVIVVVLFAISWSVQHDVDALSSHPATTIEVRGFQWQWRFHYPDGDVTVVGLPDHDPVMVLPIGETVRIVLTSGDVVHSFYVPQFLFKRDAIPGTTNRFDVNVDKPGTYRAYCAEFCGLNHARMTFTVRAVSPSEFRNWIKARQATS